MNFDAYEFDTGKYKNAKKIGGDDDNAEIPKRTALRYLENRVLPRAGIKDQKEEKNLKEAKLPALRSIKSIIGTRCKKDVLTENVTSNNATITTAPTTSTTNTEPSTTVASETQPEHQDITNINGAVRKQLQKALPNCTSETAIKKISKNKLQQAKIINKDKLIAIETQLPCENGNSLRKSLTKLKTQSNELVGIKKEEDENNVKTIGEVEDSHSTAKIDKARNIDDGDKENVLLISEYVNDIYDYLFQLELDFPIRNDHLADQQTVTPKMRAVLLDWLNSAHAHLHFVLDTFHMTVGIIDRYLQKVKDTRRSRLQLVGIAALIMAVKYEEAGRGPPVINNLMYMSNHKYNKPQIVEMEIRIFRSIDCNLSRPIAIHFLRRFAKAADIKDLQYAMSKYFMELSAIEYEFASYRPSEIAAASLFLSLHVNKGDPEKASGFMNSYWNPTLEHYSHYTAEHLQPITRKIARIVLHAPEAELNAVYKKYQSSKLHKVSLQPTLYSALMDALAEKTD